jgi:hypothetical protein
MKIELKAKFTCDCGNEFEEENSGISFFSISEGIVRIEGYCWKCKKSYCEDVTEL